MANLDIENSIKNFVTGIDPGTEKESSRKRFMERFIEEAFQPKNMNKISQQKITSITIENFKCIGDAVTIPIRPITLLFGKNSVGKSTVLQALDYYDQNWRILYGRFKTQFFGIKMSGGYTIDFRDFRSLVHRHELDRKIRIHVEYASVLNALHTSDPQDQVYQWREVVTGHKEEPFHIESSSLGFNRNGEESLRLSLSWKLEEPPGDTMVGSNGEKLIRLRKKEEDFPEDFPFEIYVNTNTTHKAFIDYCLDMFRKWLHNQQEFASGFGDMPIIRHLGPLREVPQTPDKFWTKGVGAWVALAHDPELLKKTNRYMRDILKLGYTINDITIVQKKSNITLDMNSEIMKNFKKICNSKNIKSDELKKQVYDPLVRLSRQPVIQLHVHDENKDIEVGLSYIGVGIAQIIPIVVGTLDDSHSPGIFAVEQPELHVHPAVQVALGDIFIDSIKSDYPTMQAFLEQSPAWQEVSDKFLSIMKNGKIELLDNIKNINEPAIKAILDTIIDMIKDKDPLDVEVFLDRVVGIIKDSDPLDVQFKDLFLIKEKHDHNIQVATKEFTKKLIKEFLDSIKNNNRTMLIETHSEHLLLRLLRRVRETNVRNSKKHEWRQSSMSPLHREMSEAAIRDAENQDSKDHQLTPDDLSIVYVQPTPEGVKFTPLAVTNDGDFNAPWPEGFFDERVEELF